MPSAVGRRANAQVNGNIIDAATRDANQLRLRLWRHLNVQRADRSTLKRQRLVILDEDRRKAAPLRRACPIGLDKTSPHVVKIPRFQ